MCAELFATVSQAGCLMHNPGGQSVSRSVAFWAVQPQGICLYNAGLFVSAC